MLGSGALFFHLKPRSSVLADLNPELINFYRVLKRNPHHLYRAIQRFDSSKRFYYDVRDSAAVSRVGRAARFFYLIRLSWNGLYRVNKHGWFNVPYGGRNPGTLVSLQRLLATSHALRTAHIKSGDLIATTFGARKGDLVRRAPRKLRHEGGEDSA
jgi:DNA adenine methylase